MTNHDDPLCSSSLNACTCTASTCARERARARSLMAEAQSQPPPLIQTGWTVGRLSLALLLFVTLTDMTLKVVHQQMHRLDSNLHDDYDALSMDVIRPAFSYQIHNHNQFHHHHHHDKKPSMGLGSAAISRITDALSPILPFQGGVDLRRTEYYTSGNVLENIQSMIQATYDAYANAQEVKQSDLNITATSTDSTGDKTKRKQDALKKSKKKYVLHLSASQPFVSTENIADLTLEDVAKIFDYAIQSTQQGFNSGKFVKSLLPRVKTVVNAMDYAVSKSRGKHVKVAKTPATATSSEQTKTGQMDVFNFCAAMRIFAEWRVVRQVPEGYKGYAVGMSLGHKDVVQNVVKIEKAAHDWIEYQLELTESSDVHSPSMRDLLQYELDLGISPSLPRLTESSGAMGLLWVRRQLQYQTHIFENILDVPTKYHSSTEAVSAAYTQTYDKYHGWAVQKIFSYSFQASPKVEVIYKFMNPHRLQEVYEIARGMKSSRKEVDETTSLDESDSRKSSSLEDGQPQENIFNRIGWEWDKLINSIGDKLNKSQKKKMRGGGSSSSDSGLSGDEFEEFVCAEMSRNVHEHIVEYLKVATPLLDDIASLMDELNMDDPTKV